jgi:Cys-rich four helix bundle protein (predicted Tat secretion target)
MQTLNRRDTIAGLAAAIAIVGASTAQAQKKTPMPDAAKTTPLTDIEREIIAATAECTAAGRVCLARCTDHLAAGMKNMERCQKAVMNMLSVTEAMADVAAYRTAGQAERRALAKACAAFCATCAKECEPHAAHHEECAACKNACDRCAKACEAYALA